ncbi:MAG: hypothetical protein QOG06_968 [Gaiellaceae bacterium]|nr:hypothetical protein [Gaiellaceae bacterium]
MRPVVPPRRPAPIADAVLYFPSIRPPQSEWFTRVLLYWDRVGTIMPERDEEDPGILDAYSRALVAEGLLEPVAPDATIWTAGATDYLQAFLELLDAHRLAGERQAEWVRVHLDRTGTGLAHQLVARELARWLEGEESRGWFEVERRAATLLMAFLASIIGRSDDVRMDPITDRADAVAAFTTLPEADRPPATDLEPIRYALLTDILPGPEIALDPRRIVEFKADHAALLLRFRSAVENAVLECARFDDGRLRQAKLERTRLDLKEELEEIERRMRERGWPRIVRGAVGVAGAALGVADLALSGGTAAAFAASSLGLAGSVDSAFQGRRRKEIFRRPLAYAALAQQELA